MNSEFFWSLFVVGFIAFWIGVYVGRAFQKEIQ